MRIGEYSINNLAKAICGDSCSMPYLKGYELVLLFNRYGFTDVYEQGFPSRWKYTEEKIRLLNGTDKLRMLVQELIDPRRFTGDSLNIEDAVSCINNFIKYDGYELKKNGNFYIINDLHGALVEPITTKSIDHTFVQEQIDKCDKKLLERDYNGAITNAGTLIEAIFIDIIERTKHIDIKNDGNLDNYWKEVKKILRLNVDKSSMPDTIIQILSGIDSIVKGLAGLSNDSADRHANKFKTQKHHAKLAINSAMTISDFLLDSYIYQHKN